MENSTLDNYLHKALNLYEEGNDYSQIRTLLSKEGLEAETISYIIRLVDEFAMEEGRAEANIRAARMRMIFGSMVVAVGLFITYMFYKQNFLAGFYMVLAYTPIALGGALLWSGWKGQRKWSTYQPEIDDVKLKLTKRY